ncbi:MAG: hypothetical protein V1826_00135 [bacterium]
MVNKKKGKAKIAQATKRASLKKRLAIIIMPEDRDDTPHWLFWVLVMIFVALLVTIVWQQMSMSSSLQAYLPYL